MSDDCPVIGVGPFTGPVRDCKRGRGPGVVNMKAGECCEAQEAAMTWRGKRLVDMTKEELTSALVRTQRDLERQHRETRQILDTWNAARQARARRWWWPWRAA